MPATFSNSATHQDVNQVGGGAGTLSKASSSRWEKQPPRVRPSPRPAGGPAPDASLHSTSSRGTHAHPRLGASPSPATRNGDPRPSGLDATSGPAPRHGAARSPRELLYFPGSAGLFLPSAPRLALRGRLAATRGARTGLWLTTSPAPG